MSFAFDGGLPAAAGAAGGDPTVYASGVVVASGMNATWLAGGVYTVALIDGNWGTTPQLMVCQDNAGQVGSPASCNVLMP
jgi:hypothetical protein